MANSGLISGIPCEILAKSFPGIGLELFKFLFKNEPVIPLTRIPIVSAELTTFDISVKIEPRIKIEPEEVIQETPEDEIHVHLGEVDISDIKTEGSQIEDFSGLPNGVEDGKELKCQSRSVKKSKKHAPWWSLHYNLIPESYDGHLISKARFECLICLEQTSISYSNLRPHYYIHSGAPFQCPTCSKRFRQMSKLKNHASKHHKNGSLGVATTNSEVSNEEQVEPKEAAYIQKFRNGMVKKWWMTYYTRLGANSFKCKTCGHAMTHQNMGNHRRIHLEGKFPNRAPQKVIQNKWWLPNYNILSNRAICRKCGKEMTLMNMKNHALIHSGQKPHPCPHCDHSFRQMGQLRSHIASIHGEIKTEAIQESDQPPTPANDLNEVPDQFEMFRVISKGYVKCLVCEKTMVQPNSPAHRLIHEGKKPFSCSKCHLAFRQKIHLKVHKLVKHDGQKESSILNKNEKRKRGRSFKCIHCDNSYRSVVIYKQHLRTAHKQKLKILTKEDILKRRKSIE